ncbi:LOW QUALITY PROTEIN: ERC protein 2 [Alosa sapidissima]|uniref:LOW QUALITY PROTEIN: ERC protein 2 n=1 Tax=Alosa sapidissima TaxID=34773 RepID=UPI001C0A385D|nr:LOW QUALITY PROTEIN: ERC protein 2 [Alosa sapidissima]
MYGSARSVGHAEGSPARSSRLPRSPRLGHRRLGGSGVISGGGGEGVAVGGRGGGGGGGGKTLSMENIQSLNAAYAASGPVYLGDHDVMTSSAYPKATMTLGRATNRASYSSRATAMGSSPNINMEPAGGYRERDRDSDTTMHLHSLQSGGGGSATSSLLRQAVRGGSESPLLDMHTQLRELQRENDLLRQELDVKDNQLGSSMNSIKSFWSPELKKERSLRKDEAGRTSVVREQMRVSQDENQHLQMTIQALQDELRTQRDLNQLLQQESRSSVGGGVSPERLSAVEPTEENFQRLQTEHERQAKELYLLRKTLEEMELRIESQKQTLAARDESIKKLLEMLQTGKGLPGSLADGEGVGGLRARREAEEQLGHLEVILEQKEKENLHLREELHRRNQLQADPTKTKALQTVIDMKDTKIASLERNIRDLEDDIQMMKTNGLLHTDGAEREEDLKQVEVYKSHSKFMKSKIDQLKQELSKKESELLALQTKLETLTNQNSDCKQHIEVLKESLSAKEQRANILQTEVDALRLRLEEKESFLNKKSKQLQELTEEKGTLSGEIRDMKDMLDVKERKVNVLQKKIENLLEQLKDKDKQLGSLRERVKSLQTDSSNTDTALSTLEEALSEKERIIERLREQRERDDREKLDELDTYKRENKELKDKLASLQSQLTNKESSLIDLKEQASSLASEALKKDSRLKSLELAVEQKTQEYSKLEGQLQKNPGRIEGKPAALEVEEAARRNPEMAERLKALEGEVAQHKEESGKSKAEVERLLGLLRDVEAERADKDQRLAELERASSAKPLPVSASPQQWGGLMLDFFGKQAKLPNVKATQPAQSSQKKDGLPDGAPPPQQQGGARETVERIRELERQLKDSMNTSTHREALWAQEEQARTAAQRQLEELMGALEKTRQELDITKQRLSSTQNSLAERDGHLNSMRQERRKQLEEILEMKQQALLAAISEKDANIALLELSASKKKKTQEEVMALKREKDRLMHQLKQQTQSRMKLIADNYDDGHMHPPHPHHPPAHHPHPHPGHHRGPPRGPPHAANHRPPPDQDDEEGIWA